MFFELILVNYLEQQLQDSRLSAPAISVELEASVKKVVEISDNTFHASKIMAKNEINLKENALELR